MFKPPNERITFLQYGLRPRMAVSHFEPPPTVQVATVPPAIDSGLQEKVSGWLDRRGDGTAATLRFGHYFSGVGSVLGGAEGDQERLRRADPHDARIIALEKAARAFLKTSTANFEDALAALVAEYRNRHSEYLRQLNDPIAQTEAEN